MNAKSPVNTLLIGILCILLLCGTQAALVPTKEVPLSTYNDLAYTSCLSQNMDYFDSLVGTCRKCVAADGMIRDPNSLDTRGDATQCMCAPGYYKTIVNCKDNLGLGTCKRFTCTLCSVTDLTKPAAYADRSGCAACDGTTNVMGVSPGQELDCICNTAGHVLVETDIVGNKLAIKECKPCPTGQQAVTATQIIAGKTYQGDRSTCAACPSPHMSMLTANTCTCDALYTLVGDDRYGPLSCIWADNAAEFKTVENSAVRVRYDKDTVVNSLTFTHYFVKAAAECKYFGGASDAYQCQILANLCVLQLFDRSTPACQIFASITSDRGNKFTYDVLGWAPAMPWLFYEGASTACFSGDFRQQASLNSQLLQYVVGSYTMNGTFNGYEPLDSLFNYCTRRAPFADQGFGNSRSNKWQIFGATTSGSYKCDLDTLLQKQQLFYELYLYDPTATTLYLPVPVRVLNMTIDGGSVYRNFRNPQDVCDGQDILVRRFMLADIVSGLTSTSPKIPTVIRYASEITVEVALEKETYRVKSPVLSISYGVSVPGNWPSYASAIDATDGTLDSKLTIRTADVTFSGRYTQTMEDFQKVFQAWSIACLVFCGLHAMYRFNLFTIRHTRVQMVGQQSTQGMNLSTLFEFAIICCSSWVYFFFVIQTLICWYFFTFFKLQGVPDNLLPPDDNIYQMYTPYFIFTMNITLMFICQVTYCCVIIYRQCNIDIFFLDWEPPSGPKNDARVSVWRTIFVANEWTEMTTQRMIDIRLNLFLLALILIGCDQLYAATPQPNVADLTPGKTNMVLRFAVTTWWWLCLSACQWAWKFLIYERFFAESNEARFVDFCTIAKVSILVLDEPYHGYYLHCRSPHQHADGTMTELIDMLHKEEAGLTVDRSLDSGFADVQTFQIFMSAEWKAAFSKIYNNLSSQTTVSDILRTGRKGRFGGGGGSRGMTPRADSSSPNGATDKTMRAFKELTIFLQEFVDNNFGKPGLRRTIREQSYWELMTDAPPDLNVPEQPCVFFPDRHFNYTKVMFLGREIEFLLCNIAVYSAFDMWTESTMIAIMVTYAFDWVFTFVRQNYGTAVTSSKTLIDDRFLM